MLGRATTQAIKPGDRFVKIDDPDTIWTVTRVIEFPDMPPHANLAGSGPAKRQVIVSQLVLRDRRLYRWLKDLQPQPLADASGRPSSWRSILNFFGL
jgi:hypothetical protein